MDIRLIPFNSHLAESGIYENLEQDGRTKETLSLKDKITFIITITFKSVVG
jgi:hypothetical protein